VLDRSALPVPGYEAGRLSALTAYGVLDQPRADPVAGRDPLTGLVTRRTAGRA
jgi:hypothetical protein